jgi:hypothetical protein
MIQFNLLPEVKLQFIKAQRQKRVILTIASIISAGSITVFALMFFYVNVSQKNQLNSLDKDISGSVSKLKGTQDVDKILTVQSQLNTLTSLHSNKAVASRFYDFLGRVVPASNNPKDPPPVTVSKASVSFTDSTIEFTGNAITLEYVNKFVDTLKFATFTTSLNSDVAPSRDDCDNNKIPQGYHKDSSGNCVKDEKQAFSLVVLDKFAFADKTSADKTTEKSVNYTIDLKFDPLLFSNQFDSVGLVVPQITTTRSITELPTILKPDPVPATPTKKN